MQELSHSYIKQEMIRLHEMLTGLEVKRDTMLAEEKSLVSPQEERERLFKQVRLFSSHKGQQPHSEWSSFHSQLSVLDKIKHFWVHVHVFYKSHPQQSK